MLDTIPSSCHSRFRRYSEICEAVCHEMTGHPRVDLREFRSFCFRGEGRANFVISAERKSDGIRIVWRLAKARTKGTVTHKSKSLLVNRYMQEMIAPFFSNQYLVSPKIVQLAVDDVYHLAKIPSLKPNIKVESFEDLFHMEPATSFLNLAKVPVDVQHIFALEMLDATQIPAHISFAGSMSSSTITVEIKPKQGFFQFHPDIGLRVCNNCILQTEKCGQETRAGGFKKMYDFCPLNLFSGEERKTSKALRDLFRVPHRNLRVFVNGNLIHSNEEAVPFKNLGRTLFPGGEANMEDLVTALSYVLTGSESSENFDLHEQSVLYEILAGQMKDTIGIVRANEIYQSLAKEVQHELLDKTRLPVSGLHVLDNNDDRSLIERYLLAATMKDCSIMVSMKQLDSYWDGPACVHLKSGKKFAFSIKVVDLDPKTPKNLVDGYGRFMRGVKMIRHKSKNSSGIKARKRCLDLS